MKFKTVTLKNIVAVFLGIQLLPFACADFGSSIGDSVQKVKVDDRVEFECVIIGTPTPTIEWSKLEGSLPDTAVEGHGFLVILHAKPEDSGTYQCNATNVAGSVHSRVQLIVQYIDNTTNPIGQSLQIAEMGDSVKFECFVNGTPPPTVEWSKLEGSLPATAQVGQGILVIPEAKPEHAGTYLCNATNAAGSVESEVQLVVQSSCDLSRDSCQWQNVGGKDFPLFWQKKSSYMHLNMKNAGDSKGRLVSPWISPPSSLRCMVQFQYYIRDRKPENCQLSLFRQTWEGSEDLIWTAQRGTGWMDFSSTITQNVDCSAERFRMVFEGWRSCNVLIFNEINLRAIRFVAYPENVTSPLESTPFDSQVFTVEPHNQLQEGTAGGLWISSTSMPVTSQPENLDRTVILGGGVAAVIIVIAVIITIILCKRKRNSVYGRPSLKPRDEEEHFYTDLNKVQQPKSLAPKATENQSTTPAQQQRQNATQSVNLLQPNDSTGHYQNAPANNCPMPDAHYEIVI